MLAPAVLYGTRAMPMGIDAANGFTPQPVLAAVDAPAAGLGLTAVGAGLPGAAKGGGPHAAPSIRPIQAVMGDPTPLPQRRYLALSGKA